MWCPATSLFRGGIGRTDFPDGDFEALRQSIHQKLFALPDDAIVYTGHGDQTTIGEREANQPLYRGAGGVPGVSLGSRTRSGLGFRPKKWIPSDTRRRRRRRAVSAPRQPRCRRTRRRSLRRLVTKTTRDPVSADLAFQSSTIPASLRASWSILAAKHARNEPRISLGAGVWGEASTREVAVRRSSSGASIDEFATLMPTPTISRSRLVASSKNAG